MLSAAVAEAAGLSDGGWEQDPELPEQGVR
jgi:hypothetical protein